MRSDVSVGALNASFPGSLQKHFSSGAWGLPVEITHLADDRNRDWLIGCGDDLCGATPLLKRRLSSFLSHFHQDVVSPEYESGFA
jgi:hypothetical protein